MAEERETGWDPGSFLGLAMPYCDCRTAGAVVIPAPYEATVSYGAGAGKGPAGILGASRQIELYDRELDSEPALRYGIHTEPPLAFAQGEAAGAVLGRIAARVAAAAEKRRFFLVLGGEHGISPGVFAGLVRARPNERFDIVHLDAHADLRDSYEGNPRSHACAARRLLDNPACGFLWQFGIRSLCAGEAAFIRKNPQRVRTWFAEETIPHPDADWRRELAKGLAGKKVFLTFDVDALDPAVVPGTGTPEPDGLAWRTALEICRVVADSAAETAGMDAVEAAPVPGLHYSEFNIAKLLYLMMSRLMPGAAASS
ncbi:MAG: agmatinase [Planctomycetota bacterium]|jgi:agmatinase|nr:agmatinase [Planctomycetota bacterium]